MRKMWDCLVTVIVAAAALAAADGALAHWPLARVNVEIVDRTEGRVLPIYTHAGRRYVVGKPGNEYAIRVRNAGAERVLAVMSVDGVNIITGDTASTAQSGYVFGANETGELAGWRKDMSRTAAFYFTALSNSYAVRTGRPDNVGVIGVTVFRERPRPIPSVRMFKDREGYPSADRADASESAANAAAPAPPSAIGETAQAKQQLGTGHGRSETSYAQYTSFERASDTPSETIAIYYDSYENLLAQGVPVGAPTIARVRPEAFPEGGRFVPDPR
jgi:hypothetical protein